MCRTANGADINAEPGTNPQIKDGRGNICPVTIILPTIAMESKLTFDKGNDYLATEQGKKDLVDYFLRNLDKKIDEARQMLMERFDYICSQDPRSARFMYENNTMLGYKPKEGIRSALKHGTLAVG